MVMPKEGVETIESSFVEIIRTVAMTRSMTSLRMKIRWTISPSVLTHQYYSSGLLPTSIRASLSSTFTAFYQTVNLN